MFICCLQCIRAVSITNGIPTTLLPLLFVLAVTALKDAVEDYNRHRAGRSASAHVCAHTRIPLRTDREAFVSLSHTHLDPRRRPHPQTTSRTTA